MSDWTIRWSTFSLVVGLIVAVLIVWGLQRQKNDFDWKDLVMEGDPRKASQNKIIIWGSFLINVWLIVMRTLDVGQKIPPSVDNTLQLLLGAFILKQLGNQGIDRFSRRPQTSPLVDSATDVNVTVEAPPKIEAPPNKK